MAVFDIMSKNKILPDQITYTLLLKSATNSRDSELGNKIIEHIKQNGIQPDRCLQNAMVSMFSRTGSLQKASEVFSSVIGQEVSAWNTIIAACEQNQSTQDGSCTLQRNVERHLCQSYLLVPNYAGICFEELKDVGDLWLGMLPVSNCDHDPLHGTDGKLQGQFSSMADDGSGRVDIYISASQL